ncbi:4-(cytidine 5'-diphospho)-2-C-methyl-D-erythritol kinase [Roseobacter sp. S98]|uniref:4-(cytidine 5'-diphospho)-2-C-methyl-D-erythritol kinase n=1 Tax=Roseobacter algicola (ex Choi et al. 2025) (nom. illeg.) TaxID=3092138 RepID=UPI003F512D0E
MSTDAAVRVFAPAKINLTLHVTRQQSDGYHLLDSMVVLVSTGDWLELSEAQETTLSVSGPMARGVPSDASNLVLRAAELMPVTADIRLEKHLPAAAGIGGGSSDAAACLRGLAQLSGMPLPDREALLSLGADVPVCLHAGLTRMGGIGGDITSAGPAPAWPILLVNPGISVPTPAVFKGLASKNNAPMPDTYPKRASLADQAAWMAQQRNDLEAPAIDQAPEIREVLDNLRGMDGCLLARMSGSGATCFAIMNTAGARDAALRQLREARPGWWAAAATPLNEPEFS